jgi:hypothetical protein
MTTGRINQVTIPIQAYWPLLQAERSVGQGYVPECKHSFHTKECVIRMMMRSTFFTSVESLQQEDFSRKASFPVPSDYRPSVAHSRHDLLAISTLHKARLKG